ncbi:MAG: lytic transglycosylase domain-containing protein [Desulforhopalus sp.]
MTGGRNPPYLIEMGQPRQRFIKRATLGGKLFGSASVAVVVLLVFATLDNGQASMFICRDKHGEVSFTNVPNSPDCNTFTFTERKKKTDSDNFSRKTKLQSKRKSSPKFTCDPSKFDHDIRRVARRYNVDPSLIKAIIHTESAFDHQAVSKTGAQGLMQLMPETARELRVANPFNPRENIDGGTRYFCKLMDSFNGDLILSLAAYNAGPGLVMRTGGVPRIPETLRYVNKVLKRYKQYRAAW